ncbi:MAG: 2-amino-4-hydroxy-6-hydroxymethyldihydropteridine diphosphokinase [Neisseria sp.]|nr:2-amino-4-hydroxy-6-hydroxymethyldihydropteridine diphosphokinase [Neisseria sp.]
MKQTVIIALGSNLENPAGQVRAALGEIAKLPQTELLAASSLYISAPVGYTDQPDFINAVCMVETGLDGLALLAELHKIEAAFGRERSFRNAPRTLDLDIIDFGGRSSDDETLTLPHPRAHERSFVLLPLAEIAPHYALGQHGTAAELAERLGQDGIRLFEAV